MLEATSLTPGPSGSRLPSNHPDNGQLDCLARGGAALLLDHEEALAREHEARGAAERAKQARDEMLAMVAHDLRNPLSLIEMASQLLLSDPSLDAEATRKTLQIMQRATKRMNASSVISWTQGRSSPAVSWSRRTRSHSPAC
jgi:signal transduction histidine kinase